MPDGIEQELLFALDVRVALRISERLPLQLSEVLSHEKGQT